MYGGGGLGDRLFADFQAKMLGYGQTPPEDPAEEHMKRVTRLVFRWTSAQVVVAGAALWFSGVLLAVALAGGMTLVACGAMVALQRRRAVARADSIPRVVL